MGLGMVQLPLLKALLIFLFLILGSSILTEIK